MLARLFDVLLVLTFISAVYSVLLRIKRRNVEDDYHPSTYSGNSRDMSISSALAGASFLTTINLTFLVHAADFYLYGENVGAVVLVWQQWVCLGLMALFVLLILIFTSIDVYKWINHTEVPSWKMSARNDDWKYRWHFIPLHLPMVILGYIPVIGYIISLVVAGHSLARLLY